MSATNKPLPSESETLALLREVFAECLPGISVPDNETPLFGPTAQLDSMDLVTFVSDVEELVNDRFGTQIILADERALSRSKSPFRNLQALAEYLRERLSDG
jgi:acyl carrier protein